MEELKVTLEEAALKKVAKSTEFLFEPQARTWSQIGVDYGENG
jgi:hypothetical protein